jgi:hypothetical protein
LFKYDSWSLQLKEGRRVRIIEKRTLKKMFGPRRQKVTRRWRNMPTEEAQNLLLV